MEDKKNHSQKKLSEKDLKNESYLLKKIIKMIENFLKLKISLVNIREVFELIK
jgi:Skp family chaperone for outer membrane proteins